VHRTLLGEYLLRGGAIDQTALERALRVQRSFGGLLGDVLVRLQLVTEEQLVGALGEQLGVPVVRIAELVVPRPVLAIVPEKLLRRHHAFPLGYTPSRQGGRHRLLVAFSEPQNVVAIDDIGFAAGVPLSTLLAGRRDISHALMRHFHEDRRAEVERVVGPMALKSDSASMEVVDRCAAKNFRIV
jgi:type II secretion system (T2SS) protein E